MPGLIGAKKFLHNIEEIGKVGENYSTSGLVGIEDCLEWKMTLGKLLPWDQQKLKKLPWKVAKKGEIYRRNF